jgi:hypothetical protein
MFNNECSFKMNVAGSVTSAKNRALFYRLENSLIHKFFFGIKKIRFFQKIGFLTPKKNPIFSKNRIFNPQKKIRFFQKIGFLNPKKIRFFKKNRIFNPQKNPIFFGLSWARSIEGSDF